MPVQHKFRPQHLALAVALAIGCTEISLAQQISAETIAPAAETPDQLIAALEAFIIDPDTIEIPISKVADGVNRKLGDGNDLVIVSGRGRITGIIDGGDGTNFMQLDTPSGGTLGKSHRFAGLELKRSIWTLNGSGDFDIGVLIRPNATLINDGHIEGGALAQGTLVNTGQIGGGVTVQSGGILKNSGDIRGDVVIDENGVLAGNGLVGALQVNGKFSADKMHGAPKVSGDLTLSKTAVLTYEVDADRKSEAILVSGTASLGNATLNIVAAPGDYPVISENTILIANNVEGEFGKVLNNLAFLTPKLDYSDKKVDLIFIRNDVPIESVAISENGKQFAQNIEEPKDIPQELASAANSLPAPENLNQTTGTDTSATSTTPTASADIPLTASVPSTTADSPEPATASIPAAPADTPSTASIPSTTTDAPAPATTSIPSTATNPVATAPKPTTSANAAVKALLGSDKVTASYAIEQLAGGNNANLAKATLNSDSPVSATLLSAMRQLDSASGYNKRGNRTNAPRLAAGSEDNGRVWLQALGHGGTLDRHHDALQTSTKGLVLGADWSVDDQWRIGVMGGKSDTRLDSRELDGDLDSWHLGAYALRQSGPMSLRLGATYSNHDGSTKRRVAFNGFSDRPEGRYDASTQQAFAEVGYNFGRANVSIEPFASLGYQRYQRDGYTEKGGAAALKVHGQTQNNLNSTFGLRLAKINTLDNGMQLTPRFSAGWKHTYGDIDSDTRQRLVTGGKNFTVSGAPLDRDSLLVDAGLDLGLSAKHTLGVGLNGEIGTDSRNHGVTGQWRMAF
ncbi:autotransporter domain-containing protein [Pseudomonas sp. BGI-2]|uniref:autotransporter outer membrane beta-barrel domain-containing protein n=1 Tax=Pseudomonas sp. BGI-2 TaxID=2528211 RepID=UPI00103353C4|nr:autotransporter domain-containing protein [Pseudomonas sp. BGI-2]TBN50166.1 autotransporter domain-containing protein [Pseudomonas sp. BGI-2]